MGANLLNILVTFALQSPPPPDTSYSSPSPGIAFERVSDLLQYNRVQGLSFGLGYQLPVGASIAHATVRYGLSDERVTGRLSFGTNALAGRVTLSAYHDIADLDPFSPGRTLANTANGLFAGHDNADYALSRGGSARFEKPIRRTTDLILAIEAHRMNSVSRSARSAVNDFLGGTGLFPPNPPVREGTFVRPSIEIRRRGRSGWAVSADVLGGEGKATARIFGHVVRRIGSGLGFTIRLKAGAATTPTAPQSLFRLGGVHTVRGFEYGSLRAPAFWAGQLDMTPFGGRVRPVIFLDVGQAERVSSVFSSTALVGGGVGLSLFRGLIRFDVSRALSPDRPRKLRFDLVLQGPR